MKAELDKITNMSTIEAIQDRLEYVSAFFLD